MTWLNSVIVWFFVGSTLGGFLCKMFLLLVKRWPLRAGGVDAPVCVFDDTYESRYSPPMAIYQQPWLQWWLMKLGKRLLCWMLWFSSTRSIRSGLVICDYAPMLRTTPTLHPTACRIVLYIYSPPNPARGTRMLRGTVVCTVRGRAVGHCTEQ